MNKNREIKALFPLSDSDAPLDPSLLLTADRYVLVDNLSIKLIYINSRNDYEYALAKNIAKSTDGLSYMIDIQKAVFSDGKEITSRDVANSLKRLILKGSAHIPIKELIEESDSLTKIEDNISGIQIINPTSLKIKLKRKTKEFLYYLSLADCGILHESLVKKDIIFAKDWITVSGAYTLSGEVLIENPKSLIAHKDMPSKVYLTKTPSKESKAYLEKFDVGYSSFLDKNDPSNVELSEPFRYTIGSYQYLVYLALNTRRPIFSDLSSRQWLHKEILEKIRVPENNPFFKKAPQFFLPDSFSFQKSFKPEDVLPKTIETPAVLKSGFKIESKPTLAPYLYQNLVTQLKEVIPNEIETDFNDPPSNYAKRKELRDFDAYLVGTSMSYNVVTESLNLLYKAKARFADNPSGKILALINEFQITDGSTPLIVEKIVHEMTFESEIIPLFYVSSPKFYNSNRLDISEMNTAESLTFWKIRVK